MVWNRSKVWLNRDIKNRKFFPKYEIRKKVLKSLLRSSEYNLFQKIYFIKIFHLITKKSSISIYRSGCIISGLGTSVSRKFRMSRHDIKVMAPAGYLVGLRKSSF